MENSKKYKCKYISSGHYLYRGIEIVRFGYYHPDHRVVWEGVDVKTKSSDYRGFSMGEIICQIDRDLDIESKRGQNKK